MKTLMLSEVSDEFMDWIIRVEDKEYMGVAARRVGPFSLCIRRYPRMLPTETMNFGEASVANGGSLLHGSLLH